MTYKEIREKFISGESIKVQFGVWNVWKSIHNKNMTDKQYQKLREEFKNQFDTVMDHSGMTVHTLTYKKPKENLLD